MKRTVWVILALCTVMSLSACSEPEPVETTTATTTATTEVTTSETTAEATTTAETTTATAAATTVPETEFSLSVVTDEDRYFRTVAGITGLCRIPKSDASDKMEAAEIMLAMMLDAVMEPAENRSFTITEYRNISVSDVYATRDYSAQYKNEPFLGENTWLIHVRAEFKYEGTYGSLGRCNGTWAGVLYSGEPPLVILESDSEYLMWWQDNKDDCPTELIKPLETVATSTTEATTEYIEPNPVFSPAVEAAIRANFGLEEGEEVTGEHAVCTAQLTIEFAPDATDWDLTGLEYCTHIHCLKLVNYQGEDLEFIRDIPTLWDFSMRTTDTLRTDKVYDLSPLTAIEKPRRLEIENYSLPDLTCIGELESLTTLWLENCGVSDLAPLANLENLEELNLGRYTAEGVPNNITDLSPLKNLRNLAALRLTHFSGSLEPVAGSSIEALSLAECEIESFEFLPKALHSLLVNNCGFADSDVQYLKACENLEGLAVSEHVSGWEELDLFGYVCIPEVETEKDIERIGLGFPWFVQPFAYVNSMPNPGQASDVPDLWTPEKAEAKLESYIAALPGEAYVIVDEVEVGNYMFGIVAPKNQRQGWQSRICRVDTETGKILTCELNDPFLRWQVTSYKRAEVLTVPGLDSVRSVFPKLTEIVFPDEGSTLYVYEKDHYAPLTDDDYCIYTFEDESQYFAPAGWKSNRLTGISNVYNGISLYIEAPAEGAGEDGVHAGVVTEYDGEANTFSLLISRVDCDINALGEMAADFENVFVDSVTVEPYKAGAAIKLHLTEHAKTYTMGEFGVYSPENEPYGQENATYIEVRFAQ